MDEFQSYFKKENESGQNKWDLILNELQENKILLKDLLIQLEILSEEVDFFLNKISSHDIDVFMFLKRLKYAIYSIKNTSPDYDEIKKVSAFFWELFAGYSITLGYRKNDIFEEMMERV